MSNLNRTLIREAYDTATNERERLVFVGKIISENRDDKVFNYAFKVENQIMRMEIRFIKDCCFIKQSYPDSSANIELNLKKDGKYLLKLNNGYALSFITKTSLIKLDDFMIKFKYNLIEEKTSQIISINEITIIGENETC